MKALAIVCNHLATSLVMALSPCTAAEGIAKARALRVLQDRHAALTQGQRRLDGFANSRLCSDVQAIAFKNRRHSPRACAIGTVLVIERLMLDGAIALSDDEKDAVMLGIDALGDFDSEVVQGRRVRDEVFGFLREHGLIGREAA